MAPATIGSERSNWPRPVSIAISVQSCSGVILPRIRNFTNLLQFSDKWPTRLRQISPMKTTFTSNGQPSARLGNCLEFLCAGALLVGAATAARASDPNGIYAFVDRVVVEPSEAAPERIQVWG